jgi:hypothetical protein
MHRRLGRVEGEAERNAAVLQRIEKTLGRLETETLARIEVALVEQGKTIGTALTRFTEADSRRGAEIHRHQETLFNHEGRIGHLENALEKAGANGAG